MLIPVNRPLITSADNEALSNCLSAGWVSGDGPIVERFESALKEKIQREHVVAVSNGTIALEIALRTLDLKPGDEVIIPTFSIISLVQSVLRVGAKPVLVDSDSTDWNMSIPHLIEKFTSRTKAVIAMHTYGLAVNLPVLIEECSKRGVHVIEDAAEALGQKCTDRPCGSFGTLSTFSFYANKLVTTGEGGAIATDDLKTASHLRSLRNLSFSTERRFMHEELGYNARLSSLQAALGTSQISSWDLRLERKFQIAQIYQQELEGLDGISIAPKENSVGRNGYWIFGIVLNPEFGIEAGDVIKRLRERGIDSRPFFWCVHEQPVFKRTGLFAGELYPVAEQLARHGLYLPSGLGNTDNEIRMSAQTFREIWRGLHT